MKNFLSVACACAIVCFGHFNLSAVAKEPPRSKSDREYRVHSNTEPGVKCVVTSKRRTISDALHYPGAYEQGYVQGTNDRASAASSQSATKDGELARGYTHGYQRKPYAGQQTIVPPVNEVSCGCRTRILKDILFRTELDVGCQSERQEIASLERSDAYHARAYSDGYREGIDSKAKRETYQAKTAGGEFARGFEDAYFGRVNSGQRYTVLPVQDYRCQCRLLLNSAVDREN